MILRHSYFIPGEAPSTPNLREHWAPKADRAKRVKAKVRLLGGRWQGEPLLTVRLTRIGFRRLDGDNLQASLKAHRDGVAASLRLDDASPLVEWAYQQETNADAKTHGVQVELLEQERWVGGDA